MKQKQKQNTRIIYDDYSTINYRTLSPSQRRMFTKILLTQSYSGFEGYMIKTIKDILSTLKGVTYFSDKNGNIFVEKHLTPEPPSYLPLLVSHMDTVHKLLVYNKGLAKEGKKVFNNKDGKVEGDVSYQVFKTPTSSNKGYTYFSTTGIGGDDKNGIFICLEMLRNQQVKHLKVLFTTEEETGRWGAKDSLKNQKDWFSNISYMLEPDRRGNNDIICQWGRGKTYSDEFHKLIQPLFTKFKYKPATGSVTDVFTLFEELEISCFNFSCGYYEAHSDNEYIVEHDVRRALDFLQSLLLTLPLDKVYTQEYETYSSYASGYSYNGGYSGSKNWSYSKTNTSKQMTVTPITEIHVTDSYHQPLTVNHNKTTDYFFVKNTHNITMSHLLTSVEKTFLQAEAICQELDYFIKEKLITYDEYEEYMHRLIDLWMENYKDKHND